MGQKFTLRKKNIKIYKNWKSLVSDKKINAIFISSPPKTHKKINSILKFFRAPFGVNDSKEIKNR